MARAFINALKNWMMRNWQAQYATSTPYCGTSYMETSAGIKTSSIGQGIFPYSALKGETRTREHIFMLRLATCLKTSSFTFPQSSNQFGSSATLLTERLGCVQFMTQKVGLAISQKRLGLQTMIAWMCAQLKYHRLLNKASVDKLVCIVSSGKT
jgi:hypothetical protein